MITRLFSQNKYSLQVKTKETLQDLVLMSPYSVSLNFETHCQLWSLLDSQLIHRTNPHPNVFYWTVPTAYSDRQLIFVMFDYQTCIKGLFRFNMETNQQVKVADLPKEDHNTDSILLLKGSERVAVVTIGSKNTHIHFVKESTVNTLVLQPQMVVSKFDQNLLVVFGRGFDSDKFWLCQTQLGELYPIQNFPKGATISSIQQFEQNSAIIVIYKPSGQTKIISYCLKTKKELQVWEIKHVVQSLFISEGVPFVFYLENAIALTLSSLGSDQQQKQFPTDLSWESFWNGVIPHISVTKKPESQIVELAVVNTLFKRMKMINLLVKAGLVDAFGDQIVEMTYVALQQ